MGMTQIKKLRWEQWYSKENRKILVLTFNEEDTKALSGILTNNCVNISNDFGFYCEEIKFNKLLFKYWILSSTLRHLWIHHFIGCQGIIFFIGKNTQVNNYTSEIKLVLNSEKLKDCPFLFIFENTINKNLDLIESLRKDISLMDVYVNFMFLEENQRKEIVALGLKWLSKEMTPL